MFIQSKSNHSHLRSRADLLRLHETNRIKQAQTIEEDPAQVYCPSQARIRRMCHLIRSTWSESNYIKRSGYKPLRWLVSTVSVDPGATESSDE